MFGHLYWCVVPISESQVIVNGTWPLGRAKEVQRLFRIIQRQMVGWQDLPLFWIKQTSEVKKAVIYYQHKAVILLKRWKDLSQKIGLDCGKWRKQFPALFICSIKSKRWGWEIFRYCIYFKLNILKTGVQDLSSQSVILFITWVVLNIRLGPGTWDSKAERRHWDQVGDHGASIGLQWWALKHSKVSKIQSKFSYGLDREGIKS